MADDVPEQRLTDIIEAVGMHFEVDGIGFSIRQPTTEEYDDAIALQRLVYRRTLALPAVKALEDEPCSDGEVERYKAMIATTQRSFEEAEPGSAYKDSLAEDVARLMRDLDGRTLAQEIASERAVIARDRWLCARLLCNGDGKPVFKTNDKGFPEEWERLPLRVKDASRPAIWTALGLVSTAPFSWAALRGAKS
jgi:hypothetical protein